MAIRSQLRKEMDKKYRGANAERVREHGKRWREANPERVKANSKRYNMENAEPLNEAARERRKANRELPANSMPETQQAKVQPGPYRMGSKASNQLRVEEKKMIQREKLKIVPGVPFICTLESSEGKPMSSRFHDGVEYLFSVNYRGAPSLLYLPVEGHQALQRLGAKAGDEIQLLKTQTQGQAPVFVARFVSDATLGVPTLPARDPNRMRDFPSGNSPVPTAMESATQNGGVRMLAPQPQTQQQPQTNGATAYAPQTQNEAPQPGSVALGQCLLAAIDAAIGAERYAAAKGRALTFAPEDIRAMGLSVYIGKQREGR